ncbi:MAG: ABC transporter permease [bacterium]
MRKYILKRILQAVPLLFGVTVLSFLIMHAAPGGPLAMYEMNPKVSAADIARMRAILGLDLPLHQQYWNWLTSILRGNWGYSLITGLPVAGLIAQRLPATLQLMFASFLFSVAVAVPVGILSAIRRYSALDYTVAALSFAGVSLPVFWSGLMLMLLFSAKLRLLPSSGMFTVGLEASLTDRIRHLILPVTVLSIANIANWSRYVRSSLLEVIRQDYIQTARAKGLSEKIVIYKHALKNAMIPVMTVMGIQIPLFFTGAVITETIFAWPGMGRLYYTAVMQRDYSLLMGILTISAALVIVFSLLTDIVYAFIDPRIKFE